VRTIESIDIEKITADINAEQKVDTQARNWFFTINNPENSETELYKYLSELNWVKYFIFGREKETTEHYQGYIEFTKPIRFSRMQKDFSKPNILPGAHIEARKGKRVDARDYILKICRFVDKAHTRIGEIQEYGEWVEDGQRTDLEDLILMVEDGLTDFEIRQQVPSSMLRYQTHITRYRNLWLKEKYGKQRRLDLQVTYIYGGTGTGKTRHIMDKYGDQNVFRVIDYERGTFDDYTTQNTVVFEEFRSSLKITDMLNYLDVYPTPLKARFQNKIACFNRVYILSNIPLESQYKNIQTDEPATWNAFKRRIHKVVNWDNKTHQLNFISGKECQSTKPIITASGNILIPLSPTEEDELPF